MANWWRTYQGVIVRYRVYVILAIVGFVLFTINAAIFYPGYMSNDSLYQLSQAEGLRQVDDWHPPVMALVWRTLITLTGHVFAMLLFQLGLLWLSLVSLSFYVFKLTRKMKLALIPLFLGFLPFILNISGVIWKDCQMTFSLLLAVVFVILIKESRQLRPLIKYTIMGLIVLLLIYASMIRYNALLAALPIMYLAIHYTTKLTVWREFTGVLVMVVLVLGSSVFINNIVMHAKQVHPVVGVMSDDILNSISKSDIAKMNIDAATKQLLTMGMRRCHDDIQLNTVSNCLLKKGDEVYVVSSHYESLKKAWIYTLLHRPWSYIGFRLEAFARFLFAPDKYAYYWHNGIKENRIGQSVKFKELGGMTETYVKSFGYRLFSFFYQPWFWLTAGVVSLYLSRGIKKYKAIVLALGVSAIIYILSYAPVVIGTDYRYIYWSVVATLLAYGLIALEKYCDKRRIKT